MSDKVSIIMPNYNSASFLEETISSVIEQTYGDWELLIVDDCSTDGSVEIIEKFRSQDDRIHLTVNDENRGAAFSRNVALGQASGKWVAFLDSDDVWLPEKLDKQIAFMEDNGYDFSYGYCELMDENSAALGKLVIGPKKITKRKMFRYNYLTCLTVMYNRETIGDIRIEEAIGNGRNDYALWLKVSRKSVCYLLPELLAKYRMRTQSLSHGHFFKLIKYHYELFRISEQMGKLRAFYHTAVNMFFGFWKKLIYTKALSNRETSK